MFRKKQVVDCGETEQNLDGNAAHPSLDLSGRAAGLHKIPFHSAAAS